jgi:hypothetical protein
MHKSRSKDRYTFIPESLIEMYDRLVRQEGVLHYFPITFPINVYSIKSQ